MRSLISIAIVTGLLVVAAMVASAEEFEERLARIDKALKKNPNRVHAHALESCLKRRNFAARLYYAGQITRAERSLKYCYNLLGIPPVKRARAKAAAPAPPTPEELQEEAAREFEKALSLSPNIENGLETWRSCAGCHLPEGWGLENGMVPQVAGQHRTVVIKQLADIRAGNRDAVLMAPYSAVEVIGGPQAVADVAAYIDTLEMTIDNGKGSGDDLELGERLYRENCVDCHGPSGEGDDAKHMPRIQAQQYRYLVRQFEWIQADQRRNADPEMVKQIQGFSEQEMRAVLDYVSRLQPPEELQAPEGWQNPDFETRVVVE